MTDYMKTIKKKLIDVDKTQAWLFGEIKARTGLYCDTSYLRKICNGQAGGARIIEAINEILGL